MLQAHTTNHSKVSLTVERRLLFNEVTENLALARTASQLKKETILIQIDMIRALQMNAANINATISKRVHAKEARLGASVALLPEAPPTIQLQVAPKKNIEINKNIAV